MNERKASNQPPIPWSRDDPHGPAKEDSPPENRWAKTKDRSVTGLAAELKN
jgi:hypothetical protein